MPHSDSRFGYRSPQQVNSTLIPHELHVIPSGSDRADGSQTTPLRTISRAAFLAFPGDTVIVHEGVYRESVSPERGGTNETERITYEAAAGENVVIKGSEEVSGWEQVHPDSFASLGIKADDADDSAINGSLWHLSISNTLFGDFNPYAEPLRGDWLERPADWTLSLGCVYLNGKALYEAPSVADVAVATERRLGWGPGWETPDADTMPVEPIPHSEETTWQWTARVGEDSTEIWANFHSVNPNDEYTEINVRKTCFYPLKTGINYLTVRGFEMAQAACPWAPPTGDQPGLLGTHWSKGWIIEKNDIHDARCSGISLGKEVSTGDCETTVDHRLPGYQNQMTAVFKALHSAGWSRETIGSHVVKCNKIHDCGQNGVVGHLGCVFSSIINNEIYNIGTRHEFFGHEIAGIKLHTAIDVRIAHNHIHNCTLGTWLDWEAQGTRVSSNIYDHNNRDLMIEVTSGPALVDNNVFASDYNLDNVAQGTAFAHNLFAGTIRRIPVLDRSTPYHFPHSTEVAGVALVYSGDDRVQQNIFVGGAEPFEGVTLRGTYSYNGSPTSEADYVQRVRSGGIGDANLYSQVPQPVYISGNAYLEGAVGFEGEDAAFSSEHAADAAVTTDNEGHVWVEVTVDEGALETDTSIVTTPSLGSPRIVGQPYENPDGTELTIDRDLLGTVRATHPTVGPFEALQPGKNRIQVR